MDKFSYIANAEPQYIESLYQNYKSDPAKIDGEWKKFFEGFDFAQQNFSSNGHYENISSSNLAAELKVYNAILAYREKGHLISKTNPLKPRKDRNAQLKLEHLGFSENDLTKKFGAGVAVGMENATLQEILAHLENCYCRSIGFEYDYIIDPIEKNGFRIK